MSSKHIKTQIPDYLTGELEANERETFKNHIASCSACREELENLNEIWIKLGVLPEQQPVKQLRTQFYSMLSDYKEGLDTEKQPKSRINLITRIYRSLAVRRPLLQFTFSLTFIVTGFFAGYILFSPQVLKTELKVLENEIQNIRQQAAISMLNQSSASDRLNGVTWSARVKSPSNNTLVTLLQTLNNDPNVNVRLAVVDAFGYYDRRPLRADEQKEQMREQFKERRRGRGGEGEGEGGPRGGRRRGGMGGMGGEGGPRGGGMGGGGGQP